VRAFLQAHEVLAGVHERAGQELALGTAEGERKPESIMLLPITVGDYRLAGREIGQRGHVRAARSRSLAGGQIELGDPKALLLGRHQAQSAVQLADDLEDVLGDRRRLELGKQRTTDSKVNRRALTLRDLRVRGLPDSVVSERVTAIAL